MNEKNGRKSDGIALGSCERANASVLHMAPQAVLAFCRNLSAALSLPATRQVISNTKNSVIRSLTTGSQKAVPLIETTVFKERTSKHEIEKIHSINWDISDFVYRDEARCVRLPTESG